MNTEKKNIHTDQDGLDKLKSDVNHVVNVLTETAHYLKDELSIILTKELALDLLQNGGKGSYKIYNADQSKKLDKAGLSGKVKAKMLESAQEDILYKLSNYQINLSREGLNKYNAIDALKYLSFDDKGLPSVSEQDNEAMIDRFTTYAETPAHLEMYEAHQVAVHALNHLRDVTRKHLPRAFFIAPIHYYDTFFEMSAKDEVFSAKKLNYKSF